MLERQNTDMEKLKITCPRCGADTYWHDNPTRPFCSQKCKLIDLGRWSNEEYSISGKNQSQDEEDETEI